MRTARRPRHEVNGRTLRALSPLFRYSESRDAWVLRLVGRHLGPAFVVADKPRNAGAKATKGPFLGAQAHDPRTRRFSRGSRGPALDVEVQADIDPVADAPDDERG
ncbi:MAG TPA: hypothetical protein VJT75_07310 [Thermoleophilaceae bacterium]|nr:hypothetical protein [Thermoleophilaceae bacterium]